MLYPEYMKDMQCSYLLLSGTSLLVKDYKSKMLHHNNIPHTLNMEIHSLNEANIFYYNITNLRPLSEVYQSKTFSVKDIQSILSTIIDTIMKSFEYMLKENDFILLPNFIYLGNEPDDIYLCYYSNYNMNIQEQLVQLTEYLMNKVDYKDRKSVLLIYSIYRIMREDNCTYDKILHILYKEESQADENSKTDDIPKSYDQKKLLSSNELNKSIGLNKKDDQSSKIERNNSVNCSTPLSRNTDKHGMYQKIGYKVADKDNENLPSEETSIEIYPRKIYILGITVVVIGILLFLLGCYLGIFHNALGTRVDYVKLAFGILLITLGEYYVQTRIFTIKNKVSKVIIPENKHEKLDVLKNNTSISNKTNISVEPTEIITIKESYEEATELIKRTKKSYYLKPQNDNHYKYIGINYFPYVIGKFKEEVDYVMNHPTISRKHCKFQYIDDDIYITDLGSTNGTFINNIKISPQESTKIMKGDRLNIASFQFILQEEL